MNMVPRPEALAASDSQCAHCGLPSFGARFCCPGCQAAFGVSEGLGLGGYYARRLLDPAQRALKPELAQRADLTRHIVTAEDGTHTLALAVDGLQCGACVWLIESVLAREPDLITGRVNMTSRRLKLAWRGEAARAQHFCALIEQLGYRLIPFDPACLSAASDQTGRELMRALAVAGFAASNVMLLSNPNIHGIRASFELDPGNAELVELRLRIMRDQLPVTETWLYRWTSS